MLANIKETDSILHNNYKHLSLVDGAIAWETGVIRRLYDFGQIFPVYKQDKQGRKIIENYKNPDQASKLVRLIHALFYRVPGSTGQADFGATVQLASNDPLVVVQTLAKVIAFCQNVQTEDQAFQKAVQALATHKNLQGLAPKVINNPLLTSGKNRPVWKIFIDQAYAKKNQPGYEAHVANVQIITQFCENLALIQNHLNGLLKFQALLGAEMGQVMLGALRECDSQNPDALYPLHTVEMVLLAFVYKKYSYDRTVLKVFYDALNAQFGGKVLVHELDEQWVKDSFESVTQAEALEQIENIFASKDLMQSINQHFAEFVYDAFQICAFPAPVGYATAIYEYEKDKKTVGFADCMDNTMHNFINLYAYDAEQNKFTREKLLAAMGLSAVHPVLADFLKIFGDVNMASSPQAHNAWLQVISNISYVAYNRMVDGVTGQSTKALDTGKGYIAVSENERSNELLNWLTNAGYQVLEKNQYGYELQPSIKNIIIVLDHLLQLNLFSDAGGLVKEFMRPDFIKEYFPKLCAALKASNCFLSTQKDAQQGEWEENFDVFDYTRSYIYSTINLAEIICEFVIYSGHGELKLVKAQGVKEEPGLILLLQKINDFSAQPSLSLLVTNFKHTINLAHLRKNRRYMYINLFAMPIENTDRTFQVRGMINFSLKIKLAIKDLFMRLAENQPDTIQRQKMKLKTLQSFIVNLNNEDMKNRGTDLAHLFKEIAETAARGMVDENIDIRDSALELFKTLFKKNQGLVETMQAAEKGFFSLNVWIGVHALMLFKALIIQAPDKTRKVIQKLLDDPNLKLTGDQKIELHHLLEQ